MEKQLQNKQLMDDQPVKCGGVPKPTIPAGWYGDYECQNGVWVWVPEV